MPKDTKTLCIKKGCASVLTQPLFYALFNSATNGCGISSHPDKSGHRRTNSDSPCRPSKYSIFSRYLWAGLFP